MNRLLALILCFAPLWLTAQTDFERQISERKALTDYPGIAQTGVKLAYAAWADSLIAANDLMAAKDVYERAVHDTFLTPDNRTMMALNLAMLYNNRLLMHQSALKLLNEHRFSQTYREPWRWDYAMAQTQIYMHEQDKAMTLLDSIIRPENNISYDIYATRGYLHLSMQQLQPALRDLTQAQQMSLKNATDSTDYYRMAGNIAFIYAQTDDCANAVNTLNACIRFAETNNNDIDAAIYHRKRAKIYLACGNTAAATADYKTYWALEKQFIIDHFSHMTEQQRLDYWANRKPLISGAFHIGDYDPAFLADVAIFRHQAALLGVHDTTPALLQKRLNIDAKSLQKNLPKDDAAIEFVKYPISNLQSPSYAALIITRDAINFVPLWNEEELKDYPIGNGNLMTAIASALPEDKNEIYTSDELAQMIWQPLLPYLTGKKDIWFAPDGLLHLLAIEYLPYPADTKPAFHRLTSTGQLLSTVHTFRSFSEGDKNYPLSTNSHSLLIGGLDYDYLSDIQHPTSNSPKGGLTSSSPKGGLMYWIQAREHLAQFNYLPGSRIEVDNIANNIARWDKTYEESEEQLKSEFALFSLVHLSTHGYSLAVDVTQPDEIHSDSVTHDNSLWASGFALSGANILYRYPTRDDGLLTAREICELDLRKVDFVVASACQSAQGIINDEGPAGLLRGLKLAGVNTVLATLWPVDDEATTLFMQFFYEAWNNGKNCTKQQALLNAQQRLRTYAVEQPSTKRKFNPAKLHSEQKKNIKYQMSNIKYIYSSPYYWAPFILVDDIQISK